MSGLRQTFQNNSRDVGEMVKSRCKETRRQCINCIFCFIVALSLYLLLYLYQSLPLSPPPPICSKPANNQTDLLNIVPGSSYAFTVTVDTISGHDPTYQWQKNGGNIHEATVNIHTIRAVATFLSELFCDADLCWAGLSEAVHSVS